MNLHSRTLLWLACFCSPFSLAAQTNPDAGITENGHANFSIQPTRLQVSVTIIGRSSDLTKAAAEINKRIETSRTLLKELKAIQESIVFSKPRLSGTNSPEQIQQMSQMAFEYGGGARGSEMLAQSQSVAIEQSLVAQWKLPKDETDLESLIRINELVQKINDADLAGLKQPQPVSDAQLELAEEMGAMMDEYGYESSVQNLGEPSFSYVAILDSTQFETGVAESFATAKRKIESLANATDAKIGPVRLLAAKVSQTAAKDYNVYNHSAENVLSADAETGEYKLISSHPLEANCTVTVTAHAVHQDIF